MQQKQKKLHSTWTKFIPQEDNPCQSGKIHVTGRKFVSENHFRPRKKMYDPGTKLVPKEPIYDTRKVFLIHRKSSYNKIQILPNG